MANNQADFIKPGDITADKPAPRIATQSLGEHSWVVIFSEGDEVFSGLTKWARDHRVGSGHLTAIGAWSSATLGYYDLERKAYRKNVINQQVELLSLVGNFAVDKGQPFLHAHAVVGLQDGSTRGGHLLEAYTSPTTEVFVTTSSVTLRKQFDATSGLDLIVPNLEGPR
jgi:hypothetical protein